MKINNFIKIFLVMISLLLANNLSAQIECPPMDSCSIPFTEFILDNRLTDSNTVKVRVWISHRINCDGIIEFRVDSTYAYDNGAFLENFQYEEFEIDTPRELIWLHLLEYPNDLGYSSVPLCSFDTLQIAHVYTASCGVWVKCSSKLI